MALDIKNERMGGRESYSKTIRDSGGEARETAQQMDKANQAQVRSSQTSQAKPQQGANAAKQAGTVQRPDVQQHAAKEAAAHGEKAEQAYVDVKTRAQGLNQLTNSTPQAKGSDVATKDAVAQTTQVQDAHVPKQDVPKQAVVVDGKVVQGELKKGEPAPKSQPQTAKPKASQKGTPKDGAKAKVAEQLRQSQNPEQAAKAGLMPAPDAAIAAQGQVDRGAEVGSREDADFEDEKEPEGKESSAFRLGKGRGKRSSEGLAKLGSGSSGQGEADAEADSKYAIDLTKKVKADPIPESDPNLEVYVADGQEEVDLAQKHRVFVNYVQKKLDQIAKLNDDLNEEIPKTLDNTPLSQRIEGEIGIALGKFIGSVYGEGMISG